MTTALEPELSTYRWSVWALSGNHVEVNLIPDYKIPPSSTRHTTTC